MNLTAEGLARIGADTRLAVGESYEVAQRWMLAIHGHPKKPDGITYLARHDPSRVCLALFDRAEDAIEVTPLGSLADPGHAALVATLLDTYGFGLV